MPEGTNSFPYNSGGPIPSVASGSLRTSYSSGYD